MHSSRMRTTRCSGRLSCYAHSLPYMPPCHAHLPATDTPQPHMPPIPCHTYPPGMHAPQSHMPPVMHAPCHAHHLPCMPLAHSPLDMHTPCHECSPCHAHLLPHMPSLPHMPPCHTHTLHLSCSPAMHAPGVKTLPSRNFVAGGKG